MHSGLPFVAISPAYFSLGRLRVALLRAVQHLPSFPVSLYREETAPVDFLLWGLQLKAQNDSLSIRKQEYLPDFLGPNFILFLKRHKHILILSSIICMDIPLNMQDS